MKTYFLALVAAGCIFLCEECIANNVYRCKHLAIVIPHNSLYRQAEKGAKKSQPIHSVNYVKHSFKKPGLIPVEITASSLFSVAALALKQKISDKRLLKSKQVKSKIGSVILTIAMILIFVGLLVVVAAKSSFHIL